MKDTLNIDYDGNRYWHIADHGRDTLWRHMREAQKIAVTLLEKWGWTLTRVYDDHFRECLLTKPGEANTVVYRDRVAS